MGSLSSYTHPCTSPRQRTTHLPRHPRGHLPHPRHTSPPTLLAPQPHLQGPSGQLPDQHTVTSGTMCSIGIIQCAASRQDTHQVLASGNSEMSAGHQLPIESPASSPFWSKSYAEFVTDKELLEAKAALEKCYRRRARRAGLEGTLPVGMGHVGERDRRPERATGRWERR